MTGDRFVHYLGRLRKWKVRKEGWKQASIETALGVKKTGVLRSILDIMTESVSDDGGPESIVPFQENTLEGKECFLPLGMQTH